MGKINDSEEGEVVEFNTKEDKVVGAAKDEAFEHLQELIVDIKEGKVESIGVVAVGGDTTTLYQQYFKGDPMKLAGAVGFLSRRIIDDVLDG